MTDEKLIEAAKRLLSDVNPKYRPALTSLQAEDTRMVASAVLEKAHAPNVSNRLETDILPDQMSVNAPTDDEREALTQELYDRPGFRRTDVQEPSADEDEFAPGECTGAGDCDAPIHVHGCYRPHRANQCDSPDEYGHIEPQGEPSAQVCAWCPEQSRGSAWHNDGKLHPSCGQVDHGGGWVPVQP